MFPPSPSLARDLLWGWLGGPDIWQWLSAFTLFLSSFHTNMYRVDFHFVKIVEDCLIFSIDVPVVAQSPEEPVLAIVGARHQALGKIHHPELAELIRGVQRTDKFWGEGEAPELTR